MRSYTLSGASQLIPIKPNPLVFYRGFTVKETAGVVASFIIWDGIGAAGTILDTVTLIANESRSENYGSPGLSKTGLYVQILAGSVSGSINFD